MLALPQAEHQWLNRFIGEWTWEMTASAGPDAAPHEMKGTEHVRSLGGMWLLIESESQSPDGSSMSHVITLGYDPARKCYVGTFVASMMSKLWLYEGQLDPSGHILTLESEGPSMAGPGEAKYHDIIESFDADHWIFRSKILTNGEWKEFMVGHHRRVGTAG